MNTLCWLKMTFKKLDQCGIGPYNLTIEVLHRLPRHLCSNFQLFVYTSICHAVVRKRLNVRQHSVLVMKNCENFCHYGGYLFEGVWVTCAKLPFLNSIYVLIKMFANNFALLNQQTLGRTDHVHCFQTQLMENYLVIWFWVDKRPVCCFFLYKKQSGYPDKVLG